MGFIIASLGLLTFIVFLLVYLDKRKIRVANTKVPLSFIIPCYNDSESISETIESIYNTCKNKFELIVINDKSTDDSLKILEKLRDKYDFKLLSNEKNLGKSKSLNNACDYAKNEIMIFVDADMIVSKECIDDVIQRLDCDEKLGAVSCPYKPVNKGILPLMQNIEYSMLYYLKGSYNVFSAIHIWGGFLAIKKKAFLDAGKFSVNAISEDLDLAYKLNKNHWRVQLSFVKIFTYVPDTFKSWIKQKIRWTSGAMQANLRYYKIWLRNPLHMLYFLTYTYLTFYSFYSFFGALSSSENFIATITYINAITRTPYIALQLVWALYGAVIIQGLSIRLLFMLFILPYTFNSFSSINSILFLIPFSIAYMPLYIIISIASIFISFYKLFKLKDGVRAW